MKTSTFVHRTILYRVMTIALVSLLSIMLAACGSSGSSTGPDVEELPSWYLNTPEGPDHMYASASAQSRRMQVAIDRAETDARQSLAATMESEIRSMTRDFQEELEDDFREQFVQTTQELVSQTLVGTSAAEREIQEQDDGLYRAYVLMEMPVGAAAQEFLDMLENRDEETYTRFRASEAFEEMEEQVERYEEEQNENR